MGISLDSKKVPDIEFITKKLIELVEIPSVTGDTREAIEWTRDQFKKLGIEGLKTTITNKGGLLIALSGENSEKERLLSAHVDTLGAMVSQIKSNGRLKITSIGGVPWPSIEGEHVIVKTGDGRPVSGTVLITKASSHVFGQETSKLERNAENMEVRLDEKVKTKEDTLSLGIRPGDFLSFDPRAQVTPSGFIKARHLDDKASVAALLGAVKFLSDKGLKPAYTTHLFITNYEEVGHGASSGVPTSVTEFLACDMGCVGDGLEGSEFTVSICAKDSSGPYDLELRRKLERLCEDNNIPYAVDVFPYYGSDASAALRSGANVRAGLIGTGVDASHSHERTHKEGVLATARLIVAYLLSE